MKKVDLLIINNCPSFYKINLYNEISKNCRIHVVFVGLSKQVVIDDKFQEQIGFSFSLITQNFIEKRNRFAVLLHLLDVLFKTNYNFIIYGGFDLFELKLLLFLTNPKKNCIQVESSIIESRVKGIIGFIKRILLTRISTVLPSGKLQADIFRSLNFKGRYIYTNGVGIFNKQNIQNRSAIKNEPLKYIYVGRLIDKKNIVNLIETFNKNGRNLTIVGNGNKEVELKAIAKTNIKFMGFVPNADLWKIYTNHDVFVLPSFSEPWGLVVEEALFYGLPVIISDAVGCQYEMVINPKTGVVYRLDEINGLDKAINDIEQNYLSYYKNVLAYDFEQRDKEQVAAYLKILK